MGAKLDIRNFIRGKGIKLVANLRIVELICPGNLIEHVVPLMDSARIRLILPYVGLSIFSFRLQMSKRASLSNTTVDVASSTRYCMLRTALYGSVIVSLTLVDGKIENVWTMVLGNSSFSFCVRRLPNPDPVPPPREWQSCKPCIRSAHSASNRMISRHGSIISAPFV